MLSRTLRDAGIDTRALLKDERIPTTLAVVHNSPDGGRDFSFYRSPGADLMLRADELDEELLRSCRIFHFGTLSLTDEPCRSALIRACESAREAGALLSFDPNQRPPLWRSDKEALAAIEWGLEHCDVLKIADNELAFVTGESDCDRGAVLLQARFPSIRLLNVTAGAGGSYSYYDGLRVFSPACPFGGVVDTTGAGDCFCACVLDFVLEHGLDGLTAADLHAMLRFANAAAYLVATKKDAIRSMPERVQAEALLGQY